MALRIDPGDSLETPRQHLDNLTDGHMEGGLRMVRLASLDLILQSGVGAILNLLPQWDKGEAPLPAGDRKRRPLAKETQLGTV